MVARPIVWGTGPGEGCRTAAKVLSVTAGGAEGDGWVAETAEVVVVVMMGGGACAGGRRGERWKRVRCGSWELGALSETAAAENSNGVSKATSD
ncbi:hypothetical protein ANO11243_055040 [Dothideomycetidae sp. 11243]|nr:hypothetical protein ANO11243_055040 [fungal sp. No.11243]